VGFRGVRLHAQEQLEALLAEMREDKNEPPVLAHAAKLARIIGPAQE